MKLRTAPSVETIYPVDEDPEAGSLVHKPVP